MIIWIWTNYVSCVDSIITWVNDMDIEYMGPKIGASWEENMEHRNCSCHQCQPCPCPKFFKVYLIRTIKSRPRQQTYHHVGRNIHVKVAHTESTWLDQAGFPCFKNLVKSSHNHCQALSWRCHADCHVDVTSLSVFSVTWDESPEPSPGSSSFKVWRDWTGQGGALCTSPQPG